MTNSKNAEYQRAWKHGMTVAQLRQFLDFHGRKCAICETPWDDSKRGGGLVLDHDHSCCGSNTPNVPHAKRYAKKLCGNCHRGLLCVPCNAAIGQFRDNPEFLRSAIVYLSRGRLTRLDDLPKDSPRGESHGHTRLTESQVAEIRAIHAAGETTFADLAKRYPATAGTISNIVRGKTWGPNPFAGQYEGT